ncbi:MAG: PKD domain-containing protein, partial [Verrucomicrobiales bacterium]|nr:PKD domain-containing protein [Verrucomicrobiales bacterium]
MRRPFLFPALVGFVVLFLLAASGLRRSRVEPPEAGAKTGTGFVAADARSGPEPGLAGKESGIAKSGGGAVPEPARSVPGGGGGDESVGVSERFDRWVAEARLAAPGWLSDAAFLERGVEAARERRRALKALIRENPAAALAAAVPWGVRRTLPEAVRAELEEVVESRGDLEVLCVWRDPRLRAGRGAPYVRELTLDGRRFAAYVHGRRVAQTSARGIAVHGIAVDDVVALASSPVRVLDAAEAEAARAEGRVAADGVCAVTGAAAGIVARHGDTWLPLADAGVAADFARRLETVEPGFRRVTEPPSFGEWTHGVKRLLFMRARFPDDVREPISEADAAEVMRLANDYFVATSFNNLGLVSTIGPLVTLPQPKVFYAVRGPGALIADARVATRAAGFEPDVYDLDMVRFESVPGFDWAGLGSVGGKGVWLQSSGLGVICHELGHNLGLAHANFWNTVRPELPDNPQNLPFDTDSLVGIDSVIGPGDDVEYGDPFDMMGGGGDGAAHFHGLHKFLLGWLPAAAVHTVTTSGTYRVYAHDAGVLRSGAAHLLRVRKDAERWYWIDARSARPDQVWLANGVELHWNQWHQAIGSSELLDTTPGSRHGKDDAALTVGRTFTDEAARIHVTPTRRGVEVRNGAPVPYYDVAVRVGASSGNRAPELELVSSASEVAAGESVRFVASATDADGDEVFFSWDLGEGVPGDGRSEQVHAWSTPGEYVVRCEASDGRGGRAARHMVVRVGGVRSLWIQGRVVDQSGEPLIGVRVHNGQAGTNGPYAPEYRWAYTDSDGRYTLVGQRPGSYEVGAVLYGYEVSPLSFSRPLVLGQLSGVDVDFIAAALPRASVEAVASGDEASGRAAQFRIVRSGPTNRTTRVYFRVHGSAVPGEDFRPWPLVEVQTNVIPTVLDPVNQTIEFGFVDLAPGQLGTNVSFPVLKDTAAEGSETLGVTLAYPVTRTVTSETETNTFDIPGWQVTADNGRDAWFQTRPFYRLGPANEAVVSILEGGVEAPTSLAIVPAERVVSENSGDSASFVVTRSGRKPDAPLVVPLTVSGTATPGDDYVPLAVSVRIPVDVEAVRVTVDVLDDRFVEGNETVTVSLGDGTGYVVGGRAATLSIVDNDLPWVTVNVVDPVVAENGIGARVGFQRLGDLGAPLEVDYLVGGT